MLCILSLYFNIVCAHSYCSLNDGDNDDDDHRLSEKTNSH